MHIALFFHIVASFTGGYTGVWFAVLIKANYAFLDEKQIIPTSAFRFPNSLAIDFPVSNGQDAPLNGDGEDDADAKSNGAETADEAGHDGQAK